MPKDLFGGGGSAPRPNPNIDRLAGQLSQYGEKLFALGDDQFTRAIDLADQFGESIDAIISGISEKSSLLYETGKDQLARYDNLYKPAETMQQLYAAGATWLNQESREALFDQATEQQIKALDSQGLSKKDYKAKVSEIKDAGTYGKSLMATQDTAEKQAESMAHGDVVQAETRNQERIEASAGRKGIDMKAALASGNAYSSPAITANAVDAGNRARFGVRNEIQDRTNQVVSTGRDHLDAAGRGVNSSIAADQTIAGLEGTKTNVKTNAPLTSTGFYGAGMGGVGNAVNAYNTQYQNELNKYQIDKENSGGFGEVLGTGLGIWAGAGFPLPSSEKKKKNRKPADTPETLEMIKNMDTDTYEYKDGEGPEGMRIGPMLDDMKKAGLNDGEMVLPNDTAGLALAGVKQLAKEIAELKSMLSQGRAA